MSILEEQNRIKELRIKANLSQKELANKVGISNQAISFYENGKRKPKIDKLKALADFFNVSVPYLQGKTNLSDPQLTKLIDELSNEADNIVKKYKRDTFSQLFNVVKSSEYAYKNKEKINKYVSKLKNTQTPTAYEKMENIVLYTVLMFELGLKASSGNKKASQEYNTVCSFLDGYFGKYFNGENHY